MANFRDVPRDNPAGRLHDLLSEAASAGFYDSPWGEEYPKIQILTIEELLEDGGIDYPRTPGSNVTFKRAPKARRKEALRQGELSLEGEGGG